MVIADDAPVRVCPAYHFGDALETRRVESFFRFLSHNPDQVLNDACGNLRTISCR